MTVLGCLLVQSGWNVLTRRSQDFAQWVPSHDPETVAYLQFKSMFGDGQSLLMVSWEGCTTNDSKASSLISTLRTRQKTWEVYSGGDLIDELTLPGIQDRQTVLRRLVGIAVGPDLETTWILVHIDDQFPVGTVMKTVEQAAADVGIERDGLKWGGPVAFAEAEERAADQLIYPLSFVVAILAIAIAWCCVGAVKYTVVIFVVALYSAAFGLAIMDLAGVHPSTLMMLLPALWFILSLSGAVHLIGYYTTSAATEQRARLREALSHAWRPCVMSTLTTAIGMAALCTSDLKPVREFGLYAALGLLVLLPTLFALTPIMLVLFDRGSRGSSRHPNDWWIWSVLTRTVTQYRWWIIALFTSIVVGLTPALSNVHVGSRLSTLFGEQSPVLQQCAWLEEHVGPLMPIEVLLYFPNSDEADADEATNFADRVTLLNELEQEITAEIPGARVFSIGTIVPRPPYSRRPMRRVILRSVYNKKLQAEEASFQRANLVHKQGDQDVYRLSVRLLRTGSNVTADPQKLLNHIVQRAVANSVMPETQAVVTGHLPLIRSIENQLRASLFVSYSLAFALVFAAMIFGMRSFSLGAISMLPNLFPTVVIFGVLGWLDLEIDVGGVMTASVALGIAVDDTFHYLAAYRRARSQHDRYGAVEQALRETGPAMLFTTIICGFSMLVYLQSSFLPASRFGTMLCALLCAAIVGDLIWMPALLTKRRTANERDSGT